MIKIYNYGEVLSDEIFARAKSSMDVSGLVSDIIANVRKNDDSALFEYCEKFDRARLEQLEVSSQEIEEAFSSV